MGGEGGERVAAAAWPKRGGESLSQALSYSSILVTPFRVNQRLHFLPAPFRLLVASSVPSPPPPPSPTMDYLVTLHKRRLDEEPDSWGQPDKKRPCQGLDGGFENENNIYSQLNGSSIELQKHDQPAGTICRVSAQPSIDQLSFMIQRGTLKPCPRCLAGGSGHINHIITG
ncbi:uncharacterized protein LOC144600965 [Rhinoraja longicauda]